MKLTVWERITGKKWAHVKIFTYDSIKYGKDSGKIYVHLYESNKGDRRIEWTSSFNDMLQSTLDNFVMSSTLYNERLVRWKAGRYDPGIPKFSQIGEEDTANALKGTV